MKAPTRTGKDAEDVTPFVNSRPRAAKKIGCSLSQLDIMHREGRGPVAVHLGRRRVYLDDDLMAFLLSKRA